MGESPDDVTIAAFAVDHRAPSLTCRQHSINAIVLGYWIIGIVDNVTLKQRLNAARPFSRPKFHRALLTRVFQAARDQYVVSPKLPSYAESWPNTWPEVVPAVTTTWESSCGNQHATFHCKPSTGVVYSVVIDLPGYSCKAESQPCRSPPLVVHQTKALCCDPAGK